MERSMHSLAQKSRKRIVDSLICLLGKKSYESITVSELCRKAQVDRRTFYRRSALSGLLLQTSNEFIPAVYLQYHNDLPSHFEYKARFVIGGFVNILLYWIETGAKEEPEEIAEIAAELFDEDNPYWTGYVQKQR